MPTLRQSAIFSCSDVRGAADQWLADAKAGSELGKELLGIEMAQLPMCFLFERAAGFFAGEGRLCS
jgi:hypothetical protein